MTEKPTYGELEKRVKELEHLEEELLIEREFSKATISSLPGIFYVINEHGKFLKWNRNFETLTGYSVDDIANMLPEDFFPLKRRNDVNNAIKDVFEKGHSLLEIDVISKNGRITPHLLTGARFKVKGTLCVVGVGLNISKRLQVEKSLKESEKKYRDLFNEAPIGLYRSTFDGKIISFNSTAAKIFGYNETDEDIYKVSMGDLYVNPKLRDEFLDKLNSKGKVFDSEILLRKKNGDKFWGLISAVLQKNKKDNIHYYDGFIYDITETKRLKDQLLQAQKMEAIGTLAGGIAHDFNNILGAIFGYAQLAKIKSSGNHKIEKYIDQIYMASERAKGLVQQILAFSRQTESKKIPVDVGMVVKESLKLLRATIPTTIKIDHNIKSNIGTVQADQIQIHQIVMNICTNAFHAMEDEGGRLDVELGPVKFTSSDSSVYQDIKPGEYLKLTVADTGHGMSADTISHIFEPYFTTKGVGEGTGMGLSTVHGIVKNHQGIIQVYSEPDIGTSFHIFLPLIRKKAEKVTDESDFLQNGNETILFVDDEIYLVEIGKELLSGLGYKVETFNNAADALKYFRLQPDKYDILITDLTMPDMTGDILASEFKKIRPDIPVILCTGFSKKITSENANEMGIDSLLMKPLTIYELSDTIRGLLDE
ncbi:MAG: PAS domain S-box protein [Desulfobacterales bacterium]|nr:PAS domain S-box protein [Desulfobacterales bacterium]MCP4161691.1 PAS domain S-box protein [Deltaproteobacteria bacterium]